jgi:hypothetical protein
MRCSYIYFMKDNPDRVAAVAPEHAAYWRGLELRECLGGPFAEPQACQEQRGCARLELRFARLAAARRQAGYGLGFASRLREPERASLGVLADRPCFARVYHAPAERLDPLQRLGDIAHREVRQRDGIAGSASASMDADRRRARVRLPAFSLSGLAILQANAEEVHPEVTGALWIVCGKLNE